MTAEIEVRSLGGRRFRVQVRDGAGETAHDVTVPDRLEGGPAFGEKNLERVVHESFRFLLEREHAASILRRFSLEEISRHFPEYPVEIAHRLG